MQVFAKNGCVSLGLFLCCLLLWVPDAQAGPSQAYRQAMQQAALGHDHAAVTAFASLWEVLPNQSEWKKRMFAAQVLLSMRVNRQTVFVPVIASNPYLRLATTYTANHPQAEEKASWPGVVLATLLPGAGHAWQGRWNDAATAGLMVWPMLLLTLWAAKRKMGPVTLFLALITLWLWSGTLFSSISLAERTSAETYMLWWQGLWQASGLPGRPW